MSSTQGFTLIELIITVALVAILGGLVGPNMLTFIQDKRISSQANTLVGSIHTARGEAGSRRSIVTLCASTDAATCNTSSWESGWIMFTDSNNNGNGVVDGADEIIRVQEALAGGNTLRESGFTSFTSGRVIFAANGFLFGTAPDAGTLTLCDDRGTSEAKAIVVNISGTSRFASDENSDNIVNGQDGSNISCS